MMSPLLLQLLRAAAAAVSAVERAARHAHARRRARACAQLFKCTKEKVVPGSGTRVLTPRHLAVGGNRLLVLAPHASRLGAAIVKSNRSIAELAKMSLSKSRPGRVALYYKHLAGGGAEGGAARVYVLEAAAASREFVAALQAARAGLS
jgi:hypothetical protein